MAFRAYQELKTDDMDRMREMINMNNFVILPILVPLLAAVLLIFMNRHVMLMRIFSTAASCVSIVISAALVQTVFTRDSDADTRWLESAVRHCARRGSARRTACFDNRHNRAARHPVLLPLHRRKRERAFYYSGVQFLLAGVSGAF